jgi:hypothetical protein
MSDPAVRAVQMEFAETADANLTELRAALREGDSEEHRAIAAYVIGYTKDKAKVINDLQYALQDPDDTVRNNAMRSLTAFAVYGKKNPDSEVRVSATWFVEMLNSIFWGDRNNAAVALVTLTEDRDAKILALLKERSLPSLVEMASFKYLPHALPAYILLARTLGVSEKEAQDLWSGGKRATLIARAKPARQ